MVQLVNGVVLYYCSTLLFVNSQVSITPSTSDSLERGADISFSCSSSSEGIDKNYTWLHSPVNHVCTAGDCSDDVFTFEISDEELTSITDSETSVIGKTISSYEDGGSYTCIVVDSAAIEIESVIVNIIPYFTVTPVNNTFVSFGQTATLNCMAVGYPNTITITWDRLSESGQFVPYTDGEFLQIAEITSLVVLRCKAENDAGITESDPIFLQASPVAPDTVSIEGNTLLDHGGQLQLTCTSNGGGPNKHTWYMNGNVIIDAESDNVTISYPDAATDIFTTTTLLEIIINAEIHAGAEIHCTTGNSAGSLDSEIKTITVSPVGQITALPEAIVVKRDGFANLTCLTNGGPNNHILWFYSPSNLVCSSNECSDDIFTFTPSDEDINSTIKGEQSSVVVGPISESTEGEYTCFIANEAGVDVSTSIVTFTDPPEAPSEPRVVGINITTVTLEWSTIDSSAHLILSYNIDIEPLGFTNDPFASTSKRETNIDLVLACYQHLGLETSVTDPVPTPMVTVSIIPFTSYRVRVSANNVGGTGEYSNYSYFMTFEDDIGVTTNLNGTTRNATSVILSWNAPPCPNGPISGYYVYYRMANYTQSDPINSSGYEVHVTESSDLTISTIVTGLTASKNYAFHVRAFYDGEGYSKIGHVDQEILIKIQTQANLSVSGVQAVLGGIARNSRQITIGLPSPTDLASAGINNIQYYGVVVVPKPDKDFMFEVDDFDVAYPDLQPYNNRGSNRYYIAAGWNNLSLIPENFKAGDKRRTMALRNGEDEEYYNAELDPLTSYCFYLSVHYSISDIGNELAFRYTELSCQKTERGYNLGGLIFGIILIVIFIVLCIIAIILIFLFLMRKRNRSKSPAAKNENLYSVKNPTYTTDGNSSAQIPVTDIPSYVEFMHSNDNQKLTDEFNNIESNNPSVADGDKERNRAYENSRIVLLEQAYGSHYINASLIKGKQGVYPSFIAAQNPPESNGDFWVMIWEQDVTTVVGLKYLKENKYHEYWPELSEGEKSVTKTLTVNLEKETIEETYTHRSFTIKRNDSSASRSVQQFEFNDWPENQAPTDLPQFVSLTKAVKGIAKQSDCPILVHCSDGSGRTGVFIAILAQIFQAKRKNTISVYEYVQHMRKQRASMVLNQTQYVFIYDAIKEAMNSGI